MKLCELAYIRDLGGEPILLLDDIFSELDEEHDGLVVDMAGRQQTIITTTEQSRMMKMKDWSTYRL